MRKSSHFVYLRGFIKTMPDYNQIKGEILSRLNIQQEYEILGVRFAGKPNATAWHPCHNPYKEDKTPSCGVNIGSGPQRGYLVAFNSNGNGKLGKPYATYSFWDVALDFLPGSTGDFKFVLYHYAKKTGVRLKSYPPPKEENVAKFQASITEEVRKYLNTKRGLSDESILKYEVGWDLKKERNTFPVRDENKNLVNIRYHNSKKKPKTFNHSGYGMARLWGLDRLVDADPGSTILCSEGEFDSQLCEQETGLTAVSPTNGTNAFLREWVSHFHGHHVVFVWDCDQEGRKAMKNIVLPTFKKAVLAGDVLSLKVIWLFEKDTDKNQKDFTDFITKAGGTGQQVLDLIKSTNSYQYKIPTTVLPEAIQLGSFDQIDNDKYVGKRVSVPLYVFGENSEAYHAPTEVEVTFCIRQEQSNCHGREDWDWVCDEPIQISTGGRIQLSSVAATDAQMKGALRDYVCDKGQRPAVCVQDENRATLREVYAHQVLEGGIPSEKNELVEKPVYVMGGAMVPIGQYQATGFIHSHPRNQRPTMLIDQIEPQEEDWQAFDLNNCRDHLTELQALSPIEMIQDLSQNVTRIYEREDIHLGTLLTMVSPQWIDFPGDGRIRGWISSIIIGDTGTGKSQTCDSLFGYAGVGTRVSGMTSSRTGITYAMQYDERRGWRIKAGALLKMSRQALIIDEAQDLKEFELKTMAEALDTGILKIARVESRTFESMTRCLFSCNPRAEDRYANQRSMDSFLYGCQALSDIFPQMMIRRIDLAMFVAGYDIEDKMKIYAPQKSEGPKVVSRKNFRSLIHYAWNLKPEQIYISDDVGDKIRYAALDLASKFGQGVDLPIVYPEDFRKTFCRLVTAFAVLDLASDDNFQTITVSAQHIEYVADFLNDIYSADNCRLDVYSQRYQETHGVQDLAEVEDGIKKHCELNPDRAQRIKDMLEELSKIPAGGKIKITQRQFIEKFDVERTTIFRDLQPLVKLHLIDTARGYSPTVRLIRFVSYIQKERPDFFNDL